MHVVTDEEIESEYKRLIGGDHVPNHFFAVQPTIVEDRQFDIELLKEALERGVLCV